MYKGLLPQGQQRRGEQYVSQINFTSDKILSRILTLQQSIKLDAGESLFMCIAKVTLNKLEAI